MSTRTNIVIKGNWGKIWFYRHSDGYPEGTMPTLQKFIEWIRSGKIRNNTEQASGWLILIGAIEYNTLPKFELEPKSTYSQYGNIATIKPPQDWKCGAYEPAVGVHGDIEYLYVIDLEVKTISCYENWDDKGEPEGEPLFVDTAENQWKPKKE